MLADHHNTPVFDDLWKLGLPWDIIRGMRAFDRIWGGSPTVFPSHRQPQPREEREHHLTANLSRSDRMASFRDYWIAKRFDDKDIDPKKWGYDEAHEFSCAFLGINKVRVSNALQEWRN
jgi:hypothetical protein